MPGAVTGMILAAAWAIAAQPCDGGRLLREERRIAGGDRGIELFLMRIAAVPGVERRGAVVLVHGAGAGGSSVWDLRFRDYSVMRKLACSGFDAYSVDLRGYGGSTMPAAMRGPEDAAPPAVRAEEAARDLDAAVRFAAKTSSVAAVDLVAWSWGCDVSGLYAGRHPERVRRLVLYAPVYDRRWPSRHKASGAWYAVEKEKILAHYDPAREEREVWLEHVDAMFRFAGGETLRLPSGPYRDIYGPDAPIWDAGKIRAPTMIVRGDRDPASQAEPVARLYAALTGAEERRLVVVGGASHFLMRERRYRQLQDLIAGFLTAEQMYVP